MINSFQHKDNGSKPMIELQSMLSKPDITERINR